MSQPDEGVHQGTKTLQEIAEQVEKERRERGHSPLDVTIPPEDEEEISER